MSMDWKYHNELIEAREILLNAYLTLSHSNSLTVIYTVNDDIMYCDLNKAEIYELTRLTGSQLKTQTTCKKRVKMYAYKAVKFATTNDVELTKNYFPEYSKNAGYIAEFLYRLKMTNETVEDIKQSNKSIRFDKGSDTKDNKQIKCIDNGATFTDYQTLLKACIENNYSDTEKVKKAIDFLETIYEK